MSTLAVAGSRTRVETLQFFRQRESLVFNFLFPVIMMGIFGSVFSGEIAPGVDFNQYFVSGIAAAGVLLTSFQTLAIAIAIERDDGTLKRLRGTPMPASAYFLGKIGQVLLTTVLQLTLLLAVAATFFGVELPSSVQQWWTFAWVVVLGSAAGTVLGIAVSSIPPDARSATAIMTPPMIVLQFISGVFFVYSDLPGWMQQVASLFPLKWMAQGMRSVFLADTGWLEVEPSGSWQSTETAIVLLAWLLLGLLLARLTFRWLPRRHG